MLDVISAAGLVTVQDRGRPGHMHEGVPPGGAIVPELLAAANASVGNGGDAAVVEVVGLLRVLARESLLVAVDDEGARRVARDELVEVKESGRTRARYLAIEGGVAADVVLGGRGALLVAGIGKVVKKGDLLRAAGGTPGAGAGSEPQRVDLRGNLVQVVPGPDLDAFAPGALAQLLAAELVVTSIGDRTGVRVAGGQVRPVRAATGQSAPMVRGAIQVTPSGELIVLGPDHPTTGGYPVIAVIVKADWGKFGARPPGAPIRFTTGG
jgi:5-oxoprolinase (ATP-hydrolysing) subunit C